MGTSIEAITGKVRSDASILKVMFKPKPKPDIDNWKELLNSYKISLTKVYSQPPACIQLINKKGEAVTFATLGNFSVVIGKAKSRKTFSLCLYLASALKTDNSLDLVRTNLPKGKQRVILIDTEQAEYDVSQVAKRIITMADTSNPLNFDVYSFRALSPKDRLFMVEQLIYDTEDLGIIVIDGIRDLITDINSADEATMISSKLLKWTQERHIHIITVLHQNKGDNNARGHAGSELTNKAESVLSVEKDKDLSIVKPEYLRGKDFEPFAFSVDENGIPEIIEDWYQGVTNLKPKKTAYDIDIKIHTEVLKKIFREDNQIKYQDLQTDIKVIFQSYDIKITDAQAKEFIRYYKTNSLVSDTGGKGRLGNFYSLSKNVL